MNRNDNNNVMSTNDTGNAIETVSCIGGIYYYSKIPKPVPPAEQPEARTIGKMEVVEHLLKWGLSPGEIQNKMGDELKIGDLIHID